MYLELKLSLYIINPTPTTIKAIKIQRNKLSVSVVTIVKHPVRMPYPCREVRANGVRRRISLRRSQCRIATTSLL